MLRRRSMGFLSGFLILLILGRAATGQQSLAVDVAEWTKAARNHQPGMVDAEALAIATWPWSKLKPVLNHVWQQGDVGLLLRGATLHADVSALTPPETVPAAPTGGYGVLAEDGRRVGFTALDSHVWWGRRLLDRISPRHREWARARPAVIAWYRYVTASLAARIWLADLLPHLTRALERFPDDPGLLFDAACMAETSAAPFVQPTLQPDEGSARRRPSVTLLERYRSSPLRYLKEAEKQFGRAIEQNPAFAEAYVRLGRILVLRRKYSDAIAVLDRATTLDATPTIRYYNQMFLGRALQHAGKAADARAAYERAAQLFPKASAPRLGLASVAAATGSSADAREALERMFELAPDEGRGDDPWWTYHRCAGRDVTAAYAVLAREMDQWR